MSSKNMSGSKEILILKVRMFQMFSCHIESFEGLTLGTILGTVGILTGLRPAGFRFNLLKTNGAKGGTRTPTGFHPPDPKSGASAEFRHFRISLTGRDCNSLQSSHQLYCLF